jgi:hypothetical protein
MGWHTWRMGDDGAESMAHERARARTRLAGTQAALCGLLRSPSLYSDGVAMANDGKVVGPTHELPSRSARAVAASGAK